MDQPDYTWRIRADPRLVRRFRTTALILGKSDVEVLDMILRAFVDKYGNLDAPPQPTEAEIKELTP